MQSNVIASAIAVVIINHFRKKFAMNADSTLAAMKKIVINYEILTLQGV